jgi:hypothetical protein
MSASVPNNLITEIPAISNCMSLLFQLALRPDSPSALDEGLGLGISREIASKRSVGQSSFATGFLTLQ